MFAFWLHASLGALLVGGVAIAPIDLRAGASPGVDPPGDFDGDGDTDIAVFRANAGRWYFHGVAGYTQYGSDRDIAAPADYDNDGDADIAAFRPSLGRWYVNGVANYVNIGQSGDVPVPGDYDGDGDDEPMVWRPSTGRWHAVGDATGTLWGTNGDIPVAGQWDGDAATDLAVFRPSNGTWYIQGAAGSTQFGNADDIPVPADYDGDNDLDIAVFRPTDGHWHRHGTPGSVAYGNATDIPVPGDYDGNGSSEFAVFRPSNGTWHIHGQAGSVAFGVKHDSPTPPLPGTAMSTFGCGGYVVAAGDGQVYRCTFADGFSGTSLDTNKWNVLLTGAFTFQSTPNVCYRNGPPYLQVSGGSLTLTAVDEHGFLDLGISCAGVLDLRRYSAASVNTLGKVEETVGPYEFRARVTPDAHYALPTTKKPGLHSALWMWPVAPNRAGATGFQEEIDVAEIFSIENDRAIPYIHYQANSGPTENHCTAFAATNDLTEWHTYVAEWDADGITITYDGIPCLAHTFDPATNPVPFEADFFVILEQTVGQFTNMPNGTSVFPGSLIVDHVRVWE